MGAGMPDPTDAPSHKLLGIVQAWLPVLTVVVGALWALYTYLGHEREIAGARHEQEQQNLATQTVEARKPFLEKQLALYYETAQVIGKIVTMTPDADEWPACERRFWELYWSELVMVEDSDVGGSMKEFSEQLSDYKSKYKSVASQSPEKLEELKQLLYIAALHVAEKIRGSIARQWGDHGDAVPQ
jgi:hypothetical protein